MRRGLPLGGLRRSVLFGRGERTERKDGRDGKNGKNGKNGGGAQDFCPPCPQGGI